VIALIALCIALGGVSYAAIKVPRRSVGKKQLKQHSVTTKKLHKLAVTNPKLADKSVDSRVLSQDLLDKIGGGGAKRIHYSANASSSPSLQTALDFNGLKVTAQCVQDGSKVGIDTRLTSAQDGTIQDQFNIDTGTDPHTPSPLQSGTIQIDL